MRSVGAKAPAKLNLGLEILGRRDDGFHEIRTVFQTVSIYDHLRIELAPTIDLSCSDPNLAGEQNLARRAAELIHQRFAARSGARLSLTKVIPTAAGLGGASSDAAATLRGTATLWSLSPSPSDLDALAGQLGSDVAFFLHGGTMLARGRGEDLVTIAPLQNVWFVVASPTFELPGKTAAMYHALRRDDFTDGSIVADVADVLTSGRAFDWRLLINGFDRVAHRRWPELANLREAFETAGAEFVAMTGAGPSHFTATHDQAQAKAIHQRLLRRIEAQARLFLCRSIPALPPLEID